MKDPKLNQEINKIMESENPPTDSEQKLFEEYHKVSDEHGALVDKYE